MDDPPLKKSKKEEFDAELIWSINDYHSILQLNNCLQYGDPSARHGGGQLATPSQSQQQQCSTQRSEQITSHCNSTILNSDKFVVHFKNVVMQWRMSVHRATSGHNGDNITMIGIELHLVSCQTKKPGWTVPVPCCLLTREIEVPINVQVSLTLLDNDDKDVYFGGIHSHLFQRANSNSLDGKSVGRQEEGGGLLLLLNSDSVYNEIMPPTTNNQQLRIKLGLNFDHTEFTSTKGTLVSSLDQLLTSGNMSDFSIEVGPEVFYVHKLILSVRCPYFASMFSSGMIESGSNKLIVSDIAPATLKYILGYIYTSAINPDLTYEELYELIKGTDLYQLNVFKQICFGLILAFLDENNSGELAVLGHLYHAELKHQLVISDYVSSRWGELARDSHFKDLVRQHPDAFFPPN